MKKNITLLVLFSTFIGMSVNAQVTDVDGNVYSIVRLGGTQTWFRENLKTTKYNDSTDIPLVEDAAAWVALNTPAYCWYNNDSVSNKATYGALYNWYTVNTGKLCPTGWHIPSDVEWKILEKLLGMNDESLDLVGNRGIDQGLQLRLLAGWNFEGTYDPGGHGISGFDALPGGFRTFLASKASRIANRPATKAGEFIEIGRVANWWTSTEKDSVHIWIRHISHDKASINRGGIWKQLGVSVRCLED